ncbi:carbohydrate kinase family protein [Paenibacillus sp. MBLB4367]|uniref:carbohydrate kinase family protein n=1 Tax=Paenibacillus sp. MBLB4367 TaxID=3384767 RepID=UPI003907FAB3
MGSKPIDVVVAGHICLDVIPSFGRRKGGLQDMLVPGKLVDVGPAVTATGGAVSNTGLALHRLGIRASLMGKIGDDMFGNTILDLLRGQDRRLSEGMIVSAGEHSSYSVVINPPGIDRVFLHCTGANDTFAADDLNMEEIGRARHFHFGYPPLMKRMYEDEGEQLAVMFSGAKKSGLTTSLDMAKPDPDSAAGQAAWRRILQRALPHVDVFLPSLDEILYMLDRDKYRQLERDYGAGDIGKGIDGALLSALGQELLDMGAAIVAVKLGEFGLYVRTTDDAERIRAMGRCAPKDALRWTSRELLAPCFSVNIAGTTGAGDCTIAGFLAGLVHGLSVEEVITGAVAVGAFNVEQADATSGIPAWEAVQKRIRGGWSRSAAKPDLPGWGWDGAAGLFIGPYSIS